MKMSIIKEEFKAEIPFKNREEVKAEIRACDLFGGISQFACFIFAALGVIGDAVNITLGLGQCLGFCWQLLLV